MRETAYAKINLALHVRAREADGYHRIETVFSFAEDGDILTVVPSKDLTLNVIGPFAADLATAVDNLVLRAARALDGERGAALTLEKNLPVASGIGGGSADAAATLRLLDRFWGLGRPESELLMIAAHLGADVPACLFSRTARGEGRGDTLESLADEEVSGTPLLLVNPCRPLPTAGVFRAWDGEDRGPLVDWREGRNDLEPAARMLVPEIAQVLDALSGADFVRMSGSGATCFGLFATDAARDRAAARIASSHPGWWMLATRLCA